MSRERVTRRPGAVRVGSALVAAVAPLTLHRPAWAIVFAALATVALVTGRGALPLLGGLAVVTEVGLALGRGDSAAALAVAATTGLALLAYSRTDDPDRATPTAGLRPELAVVTAAAAGAALLTGRGPAVIGVGLGAAAAVVAAAVLVGRTVQPSVAEPPAQPPTSPP